MRENQSITVSVCMIVRDEAPVMDRCLKNAARFADEIIVADTGSTDATRSIAERYTDKVFDFAWRDDFAAARNFSYEKASCDYIMWLDADDDIEAEDTERLLELKRNMPPEADAVFFAYTGDAADDNIYSDGIVLRDRMIRRALDPRWVYPIHEAIPIQREWNRLLRPDIRIYHRKARVNEQRRNLRIFERKLSEGFVMNDFNRAYYCRELVTDGRWEEGAQAYSEVLADGNKSSIYYALPFFITAMKKLGRYGELGASLEEYLERFGPDSMVLCTLGDLMRRAGEYGKARDCYLRATETEEDLGDLHVHYPAFRNFLPWIGLCRLRLSAGDTKQAEDALARAAEIRPKNLEVMLLKLYMERQRKERKT